MIDLRSDTVTQPTAGMRRAMYEAEVGDDCFADDPSVRALEEHCAAFFGKPAALFTSGGTLSNQIAMKTLTVAGDEVMLEAGSHINYYESAATACFSGVNFSLVYSDTGIFDTDDIDRLRASKCRWNGNYALPKVLVLENTLGCRGGRVFPFETYQRVLQHARGFGAQVYLDGARILHASTATGIAPGAWAGPADLMATCLSKALGAPAGSMLVGSVELIARARKYRKWFGGDLHQAGILAAAGLYAMQNHVDRLHEDHAMAERLHRLLSDIDGLPARYAGTNMVLLDIAALGVSPTVFATHLAALGVAALPCLPTEVRFVPHLGIVPEQIVRAAALVKTAVAQLRGTPATRRAAACAVPA